MNHPNLPNDSSSTMGIFDHLAELRNRLLWSCAAVLLIFCGLFPFSDTVYHWFALPIQQALPMDTSMIATDITSTFFAPFKLCLTSSFFLALPIVFYQAWAFIAPGLYPNEKRLVLPIALFSVILFYCGIAFAYFVVFPLIMAFFTSVAPDGVKVAPDISQYMSIALKLFFAFGMAFQIPVVVAALIKAKIATVASLSDKRPYIIVSCFVVGMLMTPPDPFSQSMLAIPMWLLFESGLVIGRMIAPRTATTDKTKEQAQ